MENFFRPGWAGEPAQRLRESAADVAPAAPPRAVLRNGTEAVRISLFMMKLAKVNVTVFRLIYRAQMRPFCAAVATPDRSFSFLLNSQGENTLRVHRPTIGFINIKAGSSTDIQYHPASLQNIQNSKCSTKDSPWGAGWGICTILSS